jgi:hypothetical protein
MLGTSIYWMGDECNGDIVSPASGVSHVVKAYVS